MADKDMGRAIFRAIADFSKVRKEAEKTGDSLDELDRKAKAVGGGDTTQSSAAGQKQGAAFSKGFEKGMGGGGGSRGRRMALIVTGIAALGPAAIGASGYVLSLAGSLATLVGVAAAGPGVLFGLAAGGAALGMSMKVAKERLADLAPQFKQLQQNVGNNFMYFAEKPIRNMVKTLFPDLLDGMENIGSAWGRVTGSFADAVSRNMDEGVLKGMLENVRKGVDGLEPAMEPLVRGWTKIGEVGTRYLPRISAWIVKLSDDFGAWADRVSADGSLDRWIENGITGFKNLWGILKSTFSVLKSLVDAASRATGFGLDDMNAGMAKFAGIMKKPEVQAGLEQAFENGAKSLSALLKLAGPLLVLVGKILEGLQPLIDRIAGSLTRFVDKLIPQIGPIMDALGPAIGDVFDALVDVAIELIPLLPELAELLAEVLKLAVPFLKALAEILPGLIPLIKPLLDLLTDIFKISQDLNLVSLIKLFMDLFSGKEIDPSRYDSLKGLPALFNGARDAISGFMQNPFVVALTAFIKGTFLTDNPWWETLFNNAFWTKGVPALLSVFFDPIKKMISGEWISGNRWWENLFQNAFFMEGSATRKAIDGFIAVVKTLLNGTAFGGAVKGVSGILGKLFGGKPKPGETPEGGELDPGAGLDVSASGGGTEVIAQGEATRSRMGQIAGEIVSLWTSMGNAVSSGSANIVNLARAGIAMLVTVWQSGWQSLTSVLQFAVSSWTALVQFAVFGIVAVIIGGIQMVVAGWTAGWMMAAVAVQMAFGVIVPTVMMGMAMVSMSIIMGMAMSTMAWITGWMLMIAAASGAWPVIIGVTVAGWAAVIGVFAMGVAGAVATTAMMGPMIMGAFAGAIFWLVPAGVAIMAGLIGGIMSMVPALAAALAVVTAMIPEEKGPIDKDRTLLQPAGRAVLGGFMAGIAEMVGPLQKQLQGVTAGVHGEFRVDPGSVLGAPPPGLGGDFPFMPPPPSPTAASGAGVQRTLHVTVNNPIPEPPSQSIQKTYSKIAYLGLDAREPAGV